MDSPSLLLSSSVRRMVCLHPLFAAFLPATLLAGNVAPPQNRSAAPEHAVAALEALLAAYSDGRFDQAQAMVAPEMTGYARTVVALRDAGYARRQFRIDLSDMKLCASPDTVIVRTRWLKRFLTLPALAPRQVAGRSTFVMRRHAGGWRLYASAGDNLFAGR